MIKVYKSRIKIDYLSETEIKNPRNPRNPRINHTKSDIVSNHNKAKYFEIIKEIKDENEISNYTKGNEKTIHSLSRDYREVYNNAGVFKCFEVNKNHPNGNEIHTIGYDAIISIYNKGSRKYITALVARPQQIKRYFNTKLSEEYSKEISEICKIALKNQIKGRNV